jgi:uncharacterized protein (TIGR00255 family)
MTGFGGAEEKGQGIFIGVDLRTVNNRYLKIQSRIPDELSPFAGPAEAEIRARVGRGSVFLTVRFEMLPEGASSLVNERLLASYLGLWRTLAKRHKLPGAVTLADLLNLPGVVKSPTDGGTVSLQAAEPIFRRALERALAKLAAMREKEGRALRKELLGRIRNAERVLGPLEEDYPSSVHEIEDRMFERLRDLLARRGVSIEKGEIAREAALIAERTDVAEEIERLRSHFTQARDLLEAGGEIGRQLDFLAQEMLREATTMAAKTASLRLAERVLVLKVEIDRIKEQVQNIE